MHPQYHVKLAPGDVAPYVLLPGDPKRVEVVARVLIYALYADHARNG